MAYKKSPERVGGFLRPKFGVALVLEQAPVVVDAFGRPLGFVVMMTGLCVCALTTVGFVMLVLRLANKALAG